MDSRATDCRISGGSYNKKRLDSRPEDRGNDGVVQTAEMTMGVDHGNERGGAEHVNDCRVGRLREWLRKTAECKA